MGFSKQKDNAVIRFILNGFCAIFEATLGIWNRHLTESYQIVTRAQEFDDDPFDDDNKHETLVSVTGRSVSVSY